MDTSGFYKLDSELLYSIYVSGPDFDLVNANHDQYTYPVNGWYWFVDEASARTFFGLPIAVANTDPIVSTP
jgi:hypothetical protein